MALHPDELPPPGDWVVLVRAPDGLTVVRELPDSSGGEPADAWIAFYGDSAHGLDLPGMLEAVLRPLAENAIPVFVASTYQAELILVPAASRSAARAALVAAGHEVVGSNPATR